MRVLTQGLKTPCSLRAGEQNRRDPLERDRNPTPKHRCVTELTGGDPGDGELAFLKLLLHRTDEHGMAAYFSLQQDQAWDSV